MHNESTSGGLTWCALDSSRASRGLRPRLGRLARLASAVLIIALAACGEGRSTSAAVHPPSRPPVQRRALHQLVTRTADAPLVSVRDIVSSRALVGRRIRVMGRCLSSLTEHPLGRLQRARDEWQLEDDGVAIYVIGPSPLTCAAGIEDSVTMCAFVTEDTLPAIGDLPPAPRRYLRPFPFPPSGC